MRNAAIYLIFLVVVMAQNQILLSKSQPCKDGIDFQVIAERTTTSPKSTVLLKFLVTNKSEKPLYLFRNITQCSSQIGSFSLALTDEKSQEINVLRCSADIFDMADSDAVEALTDPKSGVLLKKGESFGKEGFLELPAKKGSYLLKAKLIPPSFTDKQKLDISEHQIRVLGEECPSAAVAIVVR